MATCSASIFGSYHAAKPQHRKKNQIMSRDDEIDYRIMYPIGERNRKKPSASRPITHEQKSAAKKKRQLEEAKSQARIESRKSQPRKQISRPRSDPDARPRKSMLKATRELLC